MSGILVSLSIQYLPGTSGHRPAEGLKTGGAPQPIELFGVVLAALATLALGAVLGPEAPLIAIGGGLGVLAVKLAARDAPPMAATVMAAAGSFAAISTLLGSPFVGAFLLMEAAGLGGPVLGLVLVPGLLAAGIGTLIFIGLDNLTGLGTFSLAIPGLPVFSHPTGAMFGWALVIGVVASFVGTAIRLGGLALQAVVDKQRLVLTPAAGLVVAAAAVIFFEITGKSSENVLFSGQNQLPGLVLQAGTWSVGALVVLIVLKGIAYYLLPLGVPGRSRLPVHVHRRRPRGGRLPPARDGPGAFGGHGDRGAGHGDAQAAPDLHPAGRAAVRLGRAQRDPAGHRRRGRRLRAQRPAAPDPGRTEAGWVLPGGDRGGPGRAGGPAR